MNITNSRINTSKNTNKVNSATFTKKKTNNAVIGNVKNKALVEKSGKHVSSNLNRC